MYHTDRWGTSCAQLFSLGHSPGLLCIEIPYFFLTAALNCSLLAARLVCFVLKFRAFFLTADCAEQV